MRRLVPVLVAVALAACAGRAEPDEARAARGRAALAEGRMAAAARELAAVVSRRPEVCSVTH